MSQQRDFAGPRSSRIDHGDISNQFPLFLGIQVKFFAEGIDQDFNIFDDRFAFALIVEGVFLGPGNRMFQFVIQSSNTGRHTLVNQVLAAVGDQHGLHVCLGLIEVEQLTAIGVFSHLDDAFARTVLHIGKCPRGNIDKRVLLAGRRIDDAIGELFQVAQRRLIFLAGFARRATVRLGRLLLFLCHVVAPGI